MPLPDNPQSRSEQYLNAIATGDNSGLPEFPQSRMEQYLDVIAQNGGGGGGGGGGVLLVHEDGETGILDKTWQEIHDADVAFMESVVGDYYKSYSPIIETNENSGSYSVTFCGIANNNGTLEFWVSVYATDSASGYPASI